MLSHKDLNEQLKHDIDSGKGFIERSKHLIVSVNGFIELHEHSNEPYKDYILTLSMDITGYIITIEYLKDHVPDLSKGMLHQSRKELEERKRNILTKKYTVQPKIAYPLGIHKSSH